MLRLVVEDSSQGKFRRNSRNLQSVDHYSLQEAIFAIRIQSCPAEGEATNPCQGGEGALYW